MAVLDHPASPDPTDTLEMELPERPLPALMFSLVFHVLLLTTLGFLLSSPPSGSGSEVDRTVGIAMVHRMPERDLYVDSAETSQGDVSSENAVSSTADSVSAAAPPAGLSPPIDLDGILSELQRSPSPLSGTGIAGETTLDADAFDSKQPPGGNGDSNRTTTSVFGVSGSGSRFVYVFDRSDSMNGNGGLPLRAAKRELVNSLRTLTERQQFQIIFYNQQPKPFQTEGMTTGLMFAEEATLRRAIHFVESITAYGATEHESALRMALRMGPDVIFFLTDARIPRLSGSQLNEIRRQAERAGTTIHAIEFGSEPSATNDSFLQQLAAQNNGQYHYVDLRSLGNPQPITVP
ncbi:vWA domain-containing protein [Novipirellula artificiosorum]|uniref:VWFA domain-containing protein n=1 Tax=Novipirellula artificiosorum TaxID=2528016 RepID=A0A5C6E3Y5_9BACT|nr:hypothetical protein [Novipirellula artificiosorum]TWU42697.1 hypothetical protein Poly41_09970 [Novipirellula artificiosorum]